MTVILHYTALKTYEFTRVFSRKKKGYGFSPEQNPPRCFGCGGARQARNPSRRCVRYFSAAATLRAAAVMDRSFTSTVMSAYFS